MEKSKLEIMDFEDKKSKDGKVYCRFKTDKGWMSAFESEVIAELKKNLKKICWVQTADSDNGKFKNIRGFDSVAGEEEKPVAEEKIERPKNGQATMYASYAKDIFIALYVKDMNAPALMEVAIALVKKAKLAFEFE